MPSSQQDNSGTCIFDRQLSGRRFNGRGTTQGYALNKMCYSFNSANNRAKFKAFPEVYCQTYQLSKQQIHAVTDLDILRLLQVGGNIYFLSKLTGMYGLTIQDVIAQQSGRTTEDVEALLPAHTS